MRLRALLTGGDKLHRAPRHDLPFRLVNHYGPTENTVVTTCAVVEPGDDAVPPIGRPIDNVQVYVLDVHGQPAPVGVPGELCIAGDSLAAGYRNLRELTATKFVENPFSGTAERATISDGRSGAVSRRRQSRVSREAGRASEAARLPCRTGGSRERAGAASGRPRAPSWRSREEERAGTAARRVCSGAERMGTLQRREARRRGSASKSTGGRASTMRPMRSRHRRTRASTSSVGTAATRASR